MKKPLLFLLFSIAIIQNLRAQEVFTTDIINQWSTLPVGQRYFLAHPYEITYGPDDSLYITEKVGRVVIVSSVTGQRRVILDHRGSTFLNITRMGMAPQAATDIKQNGMMGLALHKDFKNGTNYIYIAYSYNATSLRISRFTYNGAVLVPGSEVQLVNGIPAGIDHSSGRLVYGVDDKLYYSCGDQGGNQFNTRCNPIRSQLLPTQAEFTANNYQKYEGKILRINLDGTVPSDNPTLDPDGGGSEPGVKSHIYTWGHRNPQGLVFEMNSNDGSSYPTLKAGGIFYSSEHGIRTDDELNIITSGNNYGWPLWAGFRNSPAENYRYINWSSAPASCGTGYNEVVIPSGATVTQELDYPAGSFTDPILSMYPGCNGAANCNVTLTTGTDWMQYPTIAPSAIDHYGFSNIPGWKGSLIVPTLRRGTVYRYKLNAAGNGIIGDSVPHLRSFNRFRDLALKQGHTIFVITDSIGSTSGPSGSGTGTLTNRGAIFKYTFRGYAVDGLGKSTLPTTVDVSLGNPNACTVASTVTIDANNNNIWVPITGPDGNIVAEIKANGNNLGVVTASFYRNTGPIRIAKGFRYLDRNIRITPAVQPSSEVGIRLYITKAEFDALDAESGSGISALNNLRILKNNDACGGAAVAGTQMIVPDYWDSHGANNYVLQGRITSFSSFYFGSSNMTLPLDLVNFEGSLHNNIALLKWETTNETNASHFIVERSSDGRNYTAIGTVAARGGNATNYYSHTDNDITNQPASAVQYRLKIVDTDGSVTYSKIIVIALANIANISVSPNPAADKVKLNFVAAIDGKFQWQIVDNSGRVVLQSNMQMRKGNNNVTIDVNKLAAGIYHMKLTGDGIDEKVKLQKL